MKPEIRHFSASTLALSLGLLRNPYRVAKTLQCQKCDGEGKVVNWNFTNDEDHFGVDGHSFGRVKI